MPFPPPKGKPKKFGKPSHGVKNKGSSKKGLAPSNNTILQAIGAAGGAAKKVPPFMP